MGPSDGIKTAILSGLAVGDTVVVDGTDRLSDGAKISIAAANAREPGRALDHRSRRRRGSKRTDPAPPPRAQARRTAK